MDIGNMMCYF